MEQAQRAARLEKWLRTYGSKGSLITSVSDPKPSRSGGVTSAVFGPTTLFTVTTRSPDDDRKDLYTVERSMSDFTTLRAALVSRFPGAVLGGLPEGRMTDLTKSKEEKTTKQGEILNHFLHFLCRHPFISQDQVFLAFLSVTSKFSEALKAVAPASAPTGKFSLNRMLSSASRSKRRSLERELTSGHLSDEPVTAADWWREAIDLASEPADPLRLAKDVLAELERIRKRIADLKVNIRDFKERLRGVGSSCLDLHKSFQSWLAVEYSPDAIAVAADDNGAQLQASPNADGLVVVSMSMPVLLAENANRFHSQGLIHQRMALDAAATLLSAVREEILVLDALRDEIIGARDAVNRVEDAKTHLAKKEKELAAAEELANAERAAGSLPAGQSDPAYAYENDNSAVEKKTRAARKARDDAIAALDMAVTVSSTLCRSTLNLELNFFREERIIRSDKFFAEFARVHSDYCSRSLEVWTMQPVHGLPHPPVHTSLLTAGLNVKDRVGTLQTAKSTMAKSGVYDSYSSMNTSAEDAADEESESSPQNGNQTELVEWGPDIPWDQTMPRLVEVAFDFDPEHEDELYARAGDRGTAVPFGDDRQWLHVKLANGKTGIIPTDFIRVIAKAPSTDKRRISKAKVVEDNSHVQEIESELGRMKQENERLKKELAEREQFMSVRANELRDANQAVAELRAENKSLQLDLDQAESERDRAVSERDRFANERDRILAERDQYLKQASEHERALAEKDQFIKQSTERERDRALTVSEREGPQQASTPPRQASAVATYAATELSPSQDEDLPPNWVKVLDKGRNRYFFHNTVTKESIWKKPTGSATKAAPQLQGAKRKQGE